MGAPKGAGEPEGESGHPMVLGAVGDTTGYPGAARRLGGTQGSPGAFGAPKQGQVGHPWMPIRVRGIPKRSSGGSLTSKKRQAGRDPSRWCCART